MAFTNNPIKADPGIRVEPGPGQTVYSSFCRLIKGVQIHNTNSTAKICCRYVYVLKRQHLWFVCGGLHQIGSFISFFVFGLENLRSWKQVGWAALDIYV